MPRKSLSLLLFAILFLLGALTSHAFSMRYYFDLIRGAMQYAGFSEDAIDLDPGDGWFNINNEEGGDGTCSDYWPAITLGGVYYSESLLWDRWDTSTFWGVLMMV